MAEIVNMPKLGFDMAEGVLIRWVVAVGDPIERGEVLAEIETDKATVEVESSFTGTVLHHLADEEDIIPVGEPIAVIGEEGEEVDLDSIVLSAEEEKEESQEEAPEKEEKIPDAKTEEVETDEAQLPGGVRASPLARKMAEDHGLDLQAISGSGPEGRVVKKDIEEYLEKPEPEVQEEIRPEKTPESAVVPIPIVSPGDVQREDERIPMSKLRAAIGRRMVESMTDVPHFYVTYEYKMGELMKLRKELNSALEGSGEKLSVNDFIVKAVGLALREFPNLNSSLDGDAIIRHGNINVGIAVAVENGLLTVVTKNTDLMHIRNISITSKNMASRVRSGKVKPDDIEGSTFSVSNLGMFDVDHFTAIINPPEAAILAVGVVKEIPVVENGEIKSAMRMKATISIDHRISDGAEAAQFLQTLAKYLENPVRLLL